MQKYQFVKSGVVLLAAMAFCLPAMAQETVEKSPLSGSWKWEREGLTDDVRCELRFVIKDGELVGTFKDGTGVKAKVGKVAVKDDSVSVTLVFDREGESAKVTLSGKIKGDNITGKMVDGDDEQDWKARRFTALADAEGKWQMEFTTPDGITRNPEFELKSKKGKPVVEFDAGDSGADGMKVSGVSFRDGLLTFNVSLQLQGQDLHLEYEMDIEGNDLEGSMYFEFGESADMNGDVEITGSRIK